MNSSSPHEVQETFSYFAEHRRHLGVIHVVLSGVASHAANGLVTIAVDADDATLLIVNGTQRAARLPVEAAPGQSIELRSAAAAGELAFQLRPADHVLEILAQTSTVRPPLSAQELSALRPTAFNCASCSRPLAHFDRDTTWRNLPSAHWREIADAWLCHPKGGNDFTQRYARKMEEGIWPEPEIGLVGLWELLLDASAASQELRKGPEGSSTYPEDWQPVTCPCGVDVGSHCVHGGGGGGDALERRTIKLFKHLLHVTAPKGLVVSYPAERFVVSEMLEIFQTHSTPRFVIKCDDDAAVPELLVWLFTPDVEVSYGTSETAEGAAVSHASRHCRLLYMQSTTGAQTDNAKYQPLSFSGPVYATLVAALRASTAHLPQSQRVFGQHSVAILPRS